MLNRGYAYTTIISSKYHGQTLLAHLASLYLHSTPQAWQQKLNNGEVTVNGVTRSLRVVRVQPQGPGTVRKHDELEAQGKLDHPFDAARECARLRRV